MKYLFKKVRILSGYYTDCEGIIKDKSKKYYMIEIKEPRLRKDETNFSNVLFEIKDLGKKFIMIEE